MSSKKIQEINWIRGIAAILIMLYHYTVQYEKSYGHLEKWNIELPWACGAVNTFFILTAFLTLYTLNNSLSPLKFLYKRAKRLYPAYWICICITSVSMFLFLPENFRGLKTILINLTMFQGFLGVKNVDGVYWTLSYELMFYFYAAIALVIGKRKEKAARNLVLVWTLLAYCCFLIELAGIKNQITAVIRVAMMPRFAAPFSAGALLGFTAKYKKHDILTYLGILLTVPLSFLFQERAYAIMHVITVIILMIMVQARFVYSRPQYAAAVDKMSRFFMLRRERILKNGSYTKG